MDKDRTMKLNSVKHPADGFATRGSFIFSYNERENRLTLEMFDFIESKKVLIALTTKADKDFPNIWSLTDVFDRMDFVIATYDSEYVTEEPIILY